MSAWINDELGLPHSFNGRPREDVNLNSIQVRSPDADDSSDNPETLDLDSPKNMADYSFMEGPEYPTENFIFKNSNFPGTLKLTFLDSPEEAEEAPEDVAAPNLEGRSSTEGTMDSPPPESFNSENPISRVPSVHCFEDVPEPEPVIQEIPYHHVLQEVQLVEQQVEIPFQEPSAYPPVHFQQVQYLPQEEVVYHYENVPPQEFIPKAPQQNRKRRLNFEDGPIDPKISIKTSENSLSYPTICILAIINSPEQYVLAEDIYQFVLHHFATYRYFLTDWKKGIRHSISENSYFSSGRVAGINANVYCLREGFEVEKYFGKISTKDWNYINKYIGKEKYDRLVSGDVGLPRKYFYDRIHGYPELAGPQNSAIFYHFLSLGIELQPDSPFFIKYDQNEILNEPKFVEDREDTSQLHLVKKRCNINMEIRKSKYFGKNIMPELDQTPSLETALFLHQNIEQYFSICRFKQDQGHELWEAPDYIEVGEHIFGWKFREE